jgi:hypothetical protein
LPTRAPRINRKETNTLNSGQGGRLLRDCRRHESHFLKPLPGSFLRAARLSAVRVPSSLRAKTQILFQIRDSTCRPTSRSLKVQNWTNPQYNTRLYQEN